MMFGGNTSAPTNNQGFWEDLGKSPAPNKVQVNGSAGKALTKSQTVSTMQSTATNNGNNGNSTNNNNNSVGNSTKVAQSGKLALSKTSSSGNVAASAASVTTSAGVNNKKAKGNAPAKKGSATADESINDEFSAWCVKALSAHSDVIDGKYGENIAYEQIPI